MGDIHLLSGLPDTWHAHPYRAVVASLNNLDFVPFSLQGFVPCLGNVIVPETRMPVCFPARLCYSQV